MHQARQCFFTPPPVAPSTTLVLAWLLALLSGSGTLAADDAAKPPKLFEADSTLNVTLTGPWRDFERDDRNKDPYPGTLEYVDENGARVSLDMTFERRGVKRQALCKFPPARLRFDKEEVKGTTFRGQKSLKMVTHCGRSPRYEQYYVLEMLIYRMYNLLTDYSFRIRPLQATYVEADSGKVVYEKFAFLIEDDSDVAKRNDLKKIEIPRISHTRLDSETTALFALFQYMIGNVDWAALSGPDPQECCHNVKLIGPEPLEPDDVAIPVPYDFDSAGLVDAEYAAPPEGLPINSVTQRLYRGYCVNNSHLESARQQLIDHRSEFVALIENEDLLKSGTKKKAIRYLQKFFETAADADRFEKYVIERCRK